MWGCCRIKGEGEFRTLESSEFPVDGGIQAKIRWLTCYLRSYRPDLGNGSITGEIYKGVVQHLFTCFSYLDLSKDLKTDNAPLKLQRDCILTLSDFQKLLGDINWIRPHLKLATADLKPSV